MAILAVSISVDEAEFAAGALKSVEYSAEHGARLVEWRVDELAGDPGGVEATLRLVRESPLPSIVTCRPAWEGGDFKGEESTRFDLLEAVVSATPPPRYVDIEWKVFERDPAMAARVVDAIARQPEDHRTTVILSSHDFQGRPADLLQRVEAMSASPVGGIVKLAWHARSIRDNLEALDLLETRSGPMITLCMGRFGVMSRVMAGKCGGFLTFGASLGPTAAGQLPAREMKEIYHVDTVGPDTLTYGVIGWPVEHSRGPVLHNAGFAEVGYDARYLPLPVPPEYEHFKASVYALCDHPRLGFRGASVTLPHKSHLVRFVEEAGGRVDDISRLVGAANTLVVGSGGGLACYNTDAPAAVQTLCDAMGIERDGLAGLNVAVLGAGGVARAVAGGLAMAGANVVVFNRTAGNAEAMVRDLGSVGTSGKVVTGKADALACGCFSVIINCTAIGMEGGPAPDASPLDVLSVDPVPMDAGVTVMDTVYTPIQTPLLKQAAAAGARIVSGEAMFLRQAALQFEHWTRRPAPLDVFGQISG